MNQDDDETAEFDWNEGNAEHIAEHRVTPDEAEEAVLDLKRVVAPIHSVAHKRHRAIRRQALAASLGALQTWMTSSPATETS